jgi:SecD/SecF fusion protein
MNDRRRNLFILLLVLGLAAASAFVLVTKETKLGLDLQGGVALTYEAQPTRGEQLTPDSITRAIDTMRKRVDNLGVAEPEIQRLGNNQIDVALPGADDVREAVQQVGTTAQLYFYDWEANVLNARCEPDPTDAATTGNGAAGQPGAGTLPYYGAVIRASRCAPTNEPDDTTDGLFYGVDDKAKKVLCGPQDTEADLRRACGRDKVRPTRTIEVPRGTIVIQAEAPDGEDDEAKRARAAAADAFYVLRDDPALRGTDIRNPEQQFDQGPGGNGQPNVTFDFTREGKDKWKATTQGIAERGADSFAPGTDPRSAAQHFAIVLDNQLISVPYIDFQQNPEGIDGSNGSEISGGFTIKSAQQLSNLLKTGALPVKLELISQSQVSATLGQEALDEALLAALVGFGLVALFLVFFYRLLGLLAVGALALYGVYLIALVKAIPVVLTLPGMAGLVLTIGVCADANIVIFERIKEEIAAGRSVGQAITQGYRRGITTIVDANVVTFLTAFILFMLATAGVQGFALMLGLGTIVTIISAVLATQAVLGVVGVRKLDSPALLGAKAGRKKRLIDFNGATKYLFTLSGVILLVGATAIATKGISFGIDFESGTRITQSFQQAVNEDDVRSVLNQSGLGDAKVQRLEGGSKGPNTFQISTASLRPAEVQQVTGALDSRFGTRGSPDTQSIGPTFGDTVARSAIIAVIASLIVIAAYIALRFEWKYAATTAISLMHDLLIVAGLYALTGREVTTSTVAALLTVLGFSLYDTIIVSDRMRENTPRMPRATFSQISNKSMNEVIVRSLATVTCASLPILALYVFGGEILQDFAFALLIGTVSGAYSSIFISSPVLTHWKEREPVYRRRRQAQLDALGEVPAFAPDRFAVEAPEKERRRAGRRLTAPDDPERRVSQQEFDELVRDISHEADEAPARGRAATSVAEPAPERRPKPEPEPDRSADARPEDLVLKDDRKGAVKRRTTKKPKGRPR